MPPAFVPQKWKLQLFPSRFPEDVDYPKRLKISVSVYEGAERAALGHMIDIMGAEFTRNFRRDNSHLICQSAHGEKFAKAREWGVRVVTSEWLYSCAEAGWSKESERRFPPPAHARWPSLALPAMQLPTDHIGF